MSLLLPTRWMLVPYNHRRLVERGMENRRLIRYKPRNWYTFMRDHQVQDMERLLFSTLFRFLNAVLGQAPADWVDVEFEMIVLYGPEISMTSFGRLEAYMTRPVGLCARLPNGATIKWTEVGDRITVALL